MGDWTFFSNYGHVLVCLAFNRDARLRDVAAEVGITERAVQKIVRDLQGAGILEVTKQGRCNRYRVNRRKSLRHPLESHCTVGQLLTLVARGPGRHGAVEEEEPAAVAPPPPPQPPAPSPAKPAASPEPSPDEPPPAEAARDKPKKPTPADSREQGSLF